jgi:hypothetical protein
VFKSVVQTIEQARLYPAGVQPPGTHQSYPVPVRRGQDLQLAFLYCKAMIIRPREGLQLWPPNYIAFMVARTGRFDQLRAVTASDFGQNCNMDKPMGVHLTAAERLAGGFLTKEARLYQAYDQLLPAFAGEPSPAPSEVKPAAEEFRSLFPNVAEAPLLPFYKHVGKEFFDWLTRVAA